MGVWGGPRDKVRGILLGNPLNFIALSLCVFLGRTPLVWSDRLPGVLVPGHRCQRPVTVHLAGESSFPVQGARLLDTTQKLLFNRKAGLP
jgi:hypothetical protein